jgi:hypothetical protein
VADQVAAAVGVEVAAGELHAAEAAVGGEARERVEERPARDLVVVEPQDPVAATLRVEPRQRALDRRLERHEDHPVRELADAAELPRVGAVVAGDDDLVDDAAAQLE